MATHEDSDDVCEGIEVGITMAFLYIKYGHYPASKELFDDVTAISNTLCTMTEEGGEHE